MKLIAALVLAGSLTACHTYDSMYKTTNASWDCYDQGHVVVGDAFCQTDNSTLTVYMDANLSTSGVANINSVLWNQFDPTDLTVAVTSSPVYTGGNETDIIYHQRVLAQGFLGFAWCDDAANSTKCDQHYVAFATGTPSLTAVCHETGHAVGLTHGLQASPQQTNSSTLLGCMKTPVNFFTSILGDMQVHQIDLTY
ncbi:MAG: hypothetical protein AAEB43_05185 [Acidimicrobiales bacterium]|jgi:hypothetical protein